MLDRLDAAAYLHTNAEIKRFPLRFTENGHLKQLSISTQAR